MIALISSIALLCSAAHLPASNGFSPAATTTSSTTTTSTNSKGSRSFSVGPLYATESEIPTRRRVLLSRDGPYFDVNKKSGRIEFGSTANLVTTLNHDRPDFDLIADWLSDERGLALSIWDESMLREVEPSIYQLQTMNLQFVTIQLAPTVDMKMQTRYIKDDPKQPIFLLQSVGFDPNIQLLPGITMSAEELGIVIDVSGELRPTKDGTGVTGKISFATCGNLPPPLRLVPDSALKAATDGINKVIVDFAVQNFGKGARKNYDEFRGSRQNSHED